MEILRVVAHILWECTDSRPDGWLLRHWHAIWSIFHLFFSLISFWLSFGNQWLSWKGPLSLLPRNSTFFFNEEPKLWHIFTWKQQNVEQFWPIFFFLIFKLKPKKKKKFDNFDCKTKNLTSFDLINEWKPKL